MGRRTLAFIFCLGVAGALPHAQTAVPAAPRARAAAVSVVTVQVADGSGLAMSSVQITAQGPLSREGTTGADGGLRFTGMRAGAYRLRFVHEGSITLERDITVRGGEPLLVDVTLSAAPVVAPPEPVKVAPAPEPPPHALGPPGEPMVTPIPTFLEKNFIGREGRKESPLGCTSTAMATLYQLREAWLSHTHDTADEWLYVVAGEGTLRIGSVDEHVQAGTFSLIPHTVPHALLPGGKNPLIVVSISSGPACPGATPQAR